MARGTSIHIGVNRPGSPGECTLSLCEASAWRMAELAHQAGYGAIHLLRGAAATRRAVIDLISAATEALEPGHTLFVSFSGHGSHVPDADGDEGDETDGWDETWCLHDADLVDDELVEIWRKAAAGTRVLLLTESCFGGGMGRDFDELLTGCFCARPGAGRPVVYRSADPTRGVAQYTPTTSSCISREPSNDYGIKASVLLMAAAAEERTAREGVYTRSLLQLWNGGSFRGSFCDLHRALCERVRAENPAQEPQIMMLGTHDPEFPRQRAFHLGSPVTRGGWRG